MASYESILFDEPLLCMQGVRGGQKMGPYIWIPPSPIARYFTEVQNFERLSCSAFFLNPFKV